MLNYTIDDFTLSGNLFYFKDNGEILHQTPLKELFNLKYDDEFDNPPSQENWMLQTNWKFNQMCYSQQTFNDP